MRAAEKQTLPSMQVTDNPITIERRVEFSQTDSAGIIHFSTYFTYMEAAEAELFRQLGLKLLWEESGSTYGFPRVDCQCRFHRPVTFDSLVQIKFSLAEMLSSRLRYHAVFFDESGATCAKGSMTTAFARRLPSGEMESAKLPESYRESLENWKNRPS